MFIKACTFLKKKYLSNFFVVVFQWRLHYTQFVK